MAGLGIIATCSLCGHEYARWSDDAADAAHMAGAHGMRFEPGSPRAGDPPRWVSIQHGGRRRLPRQDKVPL